MYVFFPTNRRLLSWLMFRGEQNPKISLISGSSIVLWGPIKPTFNAWIDLAKKGKNFFQLVPKTWSKLLQKNGRRHKGRTHGQVDAQAQACLGVDSQSRLRRSESHGHADGQRSFWRSQAGVVSPTLGPSNVPLPERTFLRLQEATSASRPPSLPCQVLTPGSSRTGGKAGIYSEAECLRFPLCFFLACHRWAGRPKDEIKKKFGGFHSAAVFSRRS